MIQNILTIIFVSLGTLLLLISVYGTIVYKGFYAKLHVLGVGQTLATVLIVIGLCIYVADVLQILKLLLVMSAVMIAGPIGTHIVDKVAFQNAMKKRKEEEK